MAIETCTTCNQSFEFEPLIVMGRTIERVKICDPCGEKEQAEYEERKAQEKQREADEERARQWKQICPPLYRDSDPAKLPKKFLEAINGWEFSPRGIAFTGDAGMGKTRCAFLLLKKLHFAGTWCFALSATRLAMHSANQFSDNKALKTEAGEALSKAQSVQALLLDDLGKSKMTERAELDLYHILETRTSNELPTIWTANASANDLLRMMSPDRGEPIIRRLAQFTNIL